MPSSIQVEMLGQCQHRLQHVQFVDLRGIDSRQRLRQKIRLLLVVALQAHAVTRLDHGFEQPHRQIGAHHLAALRRTQRRCGAFQFVVASLAFVIPDFFGWV